MNDKIEQIYFHSTGSVTVVRRKWARPYMNITASSYRRLMRHCLAHMQADSGYPCPVTFEVRKLKS